jgi:hypothetical protein
MKKYVDYVRRDVLEPNRSIVDEQAYANAPSAMIERTFTEELKIRPEESRLTGIATMLASAGIACTVPARSAEWKSDEVWRVDCGEKSYEIDFATGEGKTLFRFPGTKE